MANWDKVKDSVGSNWFKQEPETTKTWQFLSEPELTTNQFHKQQWVAKIKVDGEEYSVGMSPKLMEMIGEKLNFPEFITGQKVCITRTGSSKDNTTYTVSLPKP